MLARMGSEMPANSCSQCNDIRARLPISVLALKWRIRSVVCAMPCSVTRLRKAKPPYH